MGFVASIAGGLTLTLCPMFWSQAGGQESGAETILLALGIGLALCLAALFISRRLYLGIGIGCAAFALVFWSQLGLAHSLRLTGLITAWLLYLLVDMILQTNPRPGAKPPRAPKPWHTFGLLFLFVIGAINDPLVALFAPAILLSLFLSYARLPKWYWMAAGAALLFGIGLLISEYMLADAAPLALLGWRDAARWIELGDLLLAQFGIIGALLALLGLARLSRWYPPLGTVTVIAFAAYAWFGLVYYGEHREVLLLPLHDDSGLVDDLCRECLWPVGEQIHEQRDAALDACRIGAVFHSACHFAAEYLTIVTRRGSEPGRVQDQMQDELIAIKGIKGWSADQPQPDGELAGGH